MFSALAGAVFGPAIAAIFKTVLGRTQRQAEQLARHEQAVALDGLASAMRQQEKVQREVAAGLRELVDGFSRKRRASASPESEERGKL